jgi:2-polyprenyl-3-methyl-5-hydroxy-6-metoxy-1,4-benzoquinol methylase
MPEVQTLDELLKNLDDMKKYEGMGKFSRHGDNYCDVMMHKVPLSREVDRYEFISDKCKGKVVLDIGPVGHLHDDIKQKAKKVYGIDLKKIEEDTFEIDLDRIDKTAQELLGEVLPQIEIVVCGEIVEHLSNPGRFLDWLAEGFKVPVIFSVPNAWGEYQVTFLSEGVENVNKDHVAFYSYTTFKTLMSRSGFKISEFYWYKGVPYFAEGLIFVAQT